MQMHTYSFELPSTHSLPLLDEEFDKVDSASLVEQTTVAPALLEDDLTWDSQLDNGDTMSF